MQTGTYEALRDSIQTGDVLAVQNQGLMDWAIRWRTHSRYTHVAMLVRVMVAGVDRVFVAQALPETGVSLMPASRYIGSLTGAAWVVWLERTKLLPDVVNTMTAFLFDSLGEEYDWDGVFHYLLPFIHPDQGTFYCSELCAAALRAGGLMTSEEVSPQQLVEQTIFTGMTQL